MTDPLADLTAEQLDEMMVNGDYTVPDEPAEEPAPLEAEAPAAEEVADVVDEEVVDETPEAEEPLDYRAEYEKLQKHSARQAGLIGHLQGKLKAGGASPDTDPDSTGYPAPDESDGGGVDPVLANDIETLRYQNEEAQKRIEVLENQYDIKVFDRTMAVESARVDQVLGGIKPEDQPVVAAFLEKNAALIAEVKSQRDPEQISLGSRFIAQAVGNEILEARNQRMSMQRQASTASSIVAKKATVPSGSGATSTPPPPPKTSNQMTAAEADRWLREHMG